MSENLAYKHIEYTITFMLLFMSEQLVRTVIVGVFIWEKSLSQIKEDILKVVFGKDKRGVFIGNQKYS